MGHFRGGRTKLKLILFCIMIFLMTGSVISNVVLLGENVSLTFEDLEAGFTPGVTGSGDCGRLYLANPVNACLPLANNTDAVKDTQALFLLIERGGCTFEDKVRNAQGAGYRAAIIYDNEDSEVLISMAGNSAGIKIHAVFISKASGEALKKYAGVADMELWIIPSFENSAWSIMAISFICLLALSAVLATCFFVRRHRVRRGRARNSYAGEVHGMSSHQVKALPSIIFTSAVEDNCTSMACVICLDEYVPGEKLRILPCRHKFHSVCVDSWLTVWRTFCPVCKRDVRINAAEPPASEHTPLLAQSPSIAATSSSTLLSSADSVSSVSPSIRINQASFRSSVPSGSQSISSTPYMLHSLRSRSNSPSVSFIQSPMNLRNLPSQRSYGSHLASPHSFGLPCVNSRYGSPFHASSGNASSLYLGSSSQQPYLIQYNSESATSTPLASTHSLPGC